MNIRVRLWAAAACAFCAASAQASFHTFVIDQIFSNADGTVQYVVMREASGAGGQNLWSGHVFEATNTAGVTKKITFAANLPSSSTAGRSVLVATPGFAALGLVTPDYMMPVRFVPTDGGTVNYAGVNQVMLSASALPTDGVTAINRNGVRMAATPRNFANATATMTAMPVGNVEFYNISLDHYFISALAPDIDALDTGRFAGWSRTGGGFMVYPSQAAGGAGVNPVCRIRIPPPGDSHFFSASPQECSDSLAKFPALELESSNVFYVALPATSGANEGACPDGTIPVYRVWNTRIDSNHRYTTDRAIRDQMVARGYIAEGYGADQVIMCGLPGIISLTGVPSPGDPMPPMPPYPPPYQP